MTEKKVEIKIRQECYKKNIKNYVFDFEPKKKARKTNKKLGDDLDEISSNSAKSSQLSNYGDR